MPPSPRLVETQNTTEQASKVMQSLSANISRAILGKEMQAKLSVTCLVAGGHLLLEDIPGVGKTTLAESIARSCDLSFARIQFTSDLLPADVVGAPVLDAQNGGFKFRPGPLFHQLVLADELNRAPPRTQSSLLEAMAQTQVSVDGITHALPTPFAVIATQNPLDFAGTFPLPDSQLDRFLMRLSLGHPSPEVEAKMAATRGRANPALSLSPVLDTRGLLELQRVAESVAVSDAVAEYAVRLAQATRRHPELERGASTRAVLALTSAARTHALWEARDFVTPGDIRAVWVPCMAHRLMWRQAPSGASARDEAAHLLEEVARSVPAPR